jgi:hypothetical protein
MRFAHDQDLLTIKPIPPQYTIDFDLKKIQTVALARFLPQNWISVRVEFLLEIGTFSYSITAVQFGEKTLEQAREGTAVTEWKYVPTWLTSQIIRQHYW